MQIGPVAAQRTMRSGIFAKVTFSAAGEAVWAAVQLREGESVDVETLIRFCRERLGGYKVPKGIDLHAEPLPKSGPGKFLKRKLREPYWEGRDRAVN